jgi:epoxyqueuosine reductase
MQGEQLQALVEKLRAKATELGFQQLGITDTQLEITEQRLNAWLAKGYHGSMQWLEAHGEKRTRPSLLEAGTFRVISVRMDYWNETQAKAILQQDDKAYVSRYALGRDYHKMMRKRLALLADYLREQVEGSNLARAFVDSAPVMEKPLAEKAGLGWQGKHTLIINKKAGSYFFLGEIYTDIALPIDEPATNHCGTCTACIDVCPTQAIVAPYQLDARRCITYQTVENKGSIPVELRPLMGNRVFGCDDCQLVCPWNKFAQFSQIDDFKPRHGLEQSDLVELFLWSEEQFLKNTEGSAIRRTGYENWLRNIAVGLGNGKPSLEAIAALQSRLGISEQLDEHIYWALERLNSKG